MDVLMKHNNLTALSQRLSERSIKAVLRCTLRNYSLYVATKSKKGLNPHWNGVFATFLIIFVFQKNSYCANLKAQFQIVHIMVLADLFSCKSQMKLYQSNHKQPFKLVGTVWKDARTDEQYDCQTYGNRNNRHRQQSYLTISSKPIY